jgi:hypothetical protein
LTDLNELFKVIAEGKKHYEETDPVGKKIKEAKEHVKEDLSGLFAQLVSLKEDLEKELVEEETKLVSLIDEDKLKQDAKNIVNEVFGQIKKPIITEEIPYQPVIHTPEVRATQVSSDVDKYLTDKSFQQPEPDIVSKNVEDIRNKIKFLEQAIGRIAAHGPGGGEVNLRWLDDVDRSTINDGWYLRYSESKKKFEFAEVISTGGNGATGPAGATGPGGGDTGATGITGSSGAQGASGLNGSTGPTGASGVSGASGTNGASGIQGASGTQGSTGVQGASGVDGATGPQGNDGASGADSTVPGATGISGASGINGIDGATGITGASGVDGIDGATGTQGEPGATGINGASGATGTQGASGINGVDGATGLQGIDGASGIQGEPGATGIDGASGIAGATGFGVDGATGSQGDFGATGIDGASGATGLQGASGIDGATGTNGASGVNGSTGPTGASGINGSTGAQGASGVNGSTGTQGASGSTGIQGASGSTGLTGATGTQGASGPTGAGGAVGFYGSFYDSQDRIAAAESVSEPIKLGYVAEANGVQLLNDSQVKVLNAGTYNIQFSCQLHNTGGGGDGTIVNIWLAKNGIAIPDSATNITVNSNSPLMVPAWNFVLTLQANDYIELYWQTENVNIIIEHFGATGVQGATGFSPAIPSTILTITQVAYAITGATGQVGATGTQGASGVGATGATGVTGASGATGTQGASGVGATGIQGPSGSSAGRLYYLNNSLGASGISGYKQSSLIPVTTSQTTNVTNVSGTTKTLIEEFVTESEGIGVLAIPVGEFVYSVHVDTGSTNNVIKLWLDTFVRDLAGNETLIRDNYSNTLGYATPTEITWNSTLSTPVVTNLTDRLVFKLYAERVSGSNNFNVTTYYEDDITAYVKVPISTGLLGATGTQGASGATGLQGASGATGTQGASGVGATGLTGATGVSGATGNSVSASYLKYTRSTAQSTGLTAGSRIICNVSENTAGSDITIDTSTGQITLAANRTYRLRGAVPGWTSGGARPSFCWYNEATSAYIGEASQSYSSSDAAAYAATGGMAEAIITTASSTVVSFRILAVASSLTQLGGNGDFSTTGSYPWVDVEVISGNSPLLNGATGATGIQGASGATGPAGATGPTPSFGSVNWAQTYGASGFSGATGATGTVFSAAAFTGAGSPIEVTACGDANPLANGAWCRLQLYRDSIAIGLPIQVESSSSNENVPYAFHVIDNPGAGTFTYSLRVTASAGGGFQFGEAATGTFTIKELSNVRGATGAQGIQGASGVSIPAWTSGGAITIGGTTTAPTKGGTLTKDNISYRQVGAKEWEVSLTYYQTSNTGANNGSGDYLFTLPNSLSFDTTVPTQVQYQSNINTSSWYLSTYVIPGANGMITQSSTGGRLFPIIYNATQFRILTINDTAWVKCMGSGHFQLGDNPYVTLQLMFRFTST